MSGRRRSLRSRQSPGRVDKGKGGGPTIWNSAHAITRAVAPPELLANQVRCPECRNGVTPTLRGNLRAHADLFGAPCLNRSTGAQVVLDEIPDVVLRANDLPITGHCQACEKRLPPGRRLCGRCYALGQT